MEIQIPFIKMEATGNDFILFDARETDLKLITAPVIVDLCRRNFSIGADGVIFIEGRSLRYFNADGTSGAMCGNGLRAATLYVSERDQIKPAHNFELQADDGSHAVVVHHQENIMVEIRVKEQSFSDLHPKTDLPTFLNYLGSFDTGVPHVVFSVQDDLDQLDVDTLGNKLRFDLTFQPQGTNVNFATRSNNGMIFLRTYERGVEHETLSCGTGATATFLAYQRLGTDQLHTLDISTRGGMLQIRQKNKKLFLSGPANIVYSGRVTVKKNLN